MINRLLSIAVIVTIGLLTLALQVRTDTRELVRDLEARNSDLAERQDIITDLLNAISHDLRTPLMALSVTMEHAAEGAYGKLPGAYVSVLRNSRLLIDDLHHLAETLLLVARFEAAGLELTAERIALAKTVEELLSEFRASANARGVILVGELREDATVIAARGDLRRAIANLLSNALSYTPRGGRIDVSIRRRDGFAEVVVADNGFGVDPALRERLFERGSRGTRAGAGLGFYVVRRIAEAAGGTLRYDPRDRRGSIFRLSLPEFGGSTCA